MKATPEISSPEALEARIAPAVVYGLDSLNNLISFDSATPSTIIDSVPITGLAVGDDLIGIDFRPATGDLYSVGESARVYRINTNTGVATAGPLLAADPSDTTNPFTGFTGGNNFGIDFNPVVDRLRIVVGTDENLRVDVDTGLVITDTNLTPAPSRVVGAAYSNDFAGAGSTLLYGLDSDADTLVTINPPNNGTINTIGNLGVDTTEVLAFDILTTGASDTAFAALKVAGFGSALYTINLTTGAATLVGDIGGAGVDLVKGLAAVPVQAVTVSGKTAQFTDVDGDTVTVTTDKGAFEKNDFALVPSGDGFQLRSVNLSDDGAEFDGATLSITATRGTNGGDSLVNVGYINATGVDLANVTIEGDLGQIDAGNSTAATPALGNIFVNSIGLLGTSTQGGTPNSDSAFVGAVGKIIVQSGITDSSITITGGADGDLTKLQVGGSLRSLDLSATGSIGSVDQGTTPGAYKLRGGIVVAGSADDARFDAGDVISKVRIGGDFEEGRVRAEGTAGALTNRAATALGSLTVGGSLLSTNILLGTIENNADVRAGRATIGGDWVASDFAVGVDDGADNTYGTTDDVPLAVNTAGIMSRIAGIKVAGQVIGTPTPTTDGFGFVAERIDLFKVGGNKFPLNPGPANDNFKVGATNDVRVRELATIVTLDV